MKPKSPLNRRQAIQALATSTITAPLMARSMSIKLTHTTQKNSYPGSHQISTSVPDTNQFVMSF